MHHRTSQPSTASRWLASSSRYLSGACYSPRSAAYDAEPQRLLGCLYTHMGLPSCLLRPFQDRASWRTPVPGSASFRLACKAVTEIRAERISVWRSSIPYGVTLLDFVRRSIVSRKQISDAQRQSSEDASRVLGMKCSKSFRISSWSHSSNCISASETETTALWL